MTRVSSDASAVCLSCALLSSTRCTVPALYVLTIDDHSLSDTVVIRPSAPSAPTPAMKKHAGPADDDADEDDMMIETRVEVDRRDGSGWVDVEARQNTAGAKRAGM
mgnify:CR=1 FL=1